VVIRGERNSTIQLILLSSKFFLNLFCKRSSKIFFKLVLHDLFVRSCLKKIQKPIF